MTEGIADNRALRRLAPILFGACAWVFLSANAAHAEWKPTGPFGGEAELIRIAPGAGMVIAGARNGLLFVSRNGGAYWNNLPFPAQFTGVLHALEVDPRVPGTWYAGMEGDRPFTSGVYKTTDAGQSWTMLQGMKGKAVWSLALWPENPDVIAAGAADGVYRSDNAGQSWKRISPEDNHELSPVVSLAFHPSKSGVLYAGTTHLPWRTLDGGNSWESIHTGMLDDSDVFSMQVDKHDPQTVFASACSGVYESGDAASHWRKLTTPAGAFRTYFVSEDAAHEHVIFAGTSDGLLRSDDGGHVFRIVSPYPIKSIAFDPSLSGRIFFASTTAGILVSTDDGKTLHESNFGFTNRNFTALTGSGQFLYTNSVFEGSGGIYRTEATPLHWVRTGSEPASDQILMMTAAPDQPSTLFAAAYHRLFKSADAGKTWIPLPKQAEGRVSSIAAMDANTLLVGTDEGVFRASGTNWRLITPAGVHGIQSVSVPGRQFITAVAAHGAFASSNSGERWKTCGNPTPSTEWYGIAFDTASGHGLFSTALAATSEGLFRSIDGCDSWTKVTGSLQPGTVSVVLFHPAHPAEAYTSQGGQVFRSDDGGANWYTLEPGGNKDEWPSALLFLPADPGRLFALFPRRGIFSNIVEGPQPATGQ